jgi:hypothetical protein
VKRLLIVLSVVLLVSCTNELPDGPSVSSSASPKIRELRVTHFLEDGQSGNGECEGYDVEWQTPDASNADAEPARVTVTRDDETVFALEGTNPTDQFVGLWCGDVTGDGSIEFGVHEFTGGAHCCFGIRVLTLDGRRTLLNKQLENGGANPPAQLDGTQPLEIPGSSDVLAYYADLPFSASPTLPLVFALRDGVYKDRTTEFPDHIRKSLKDADEQLTMALREYADVPEAIRGSALGVFGHHVLLGDEDEALGEIAAKLDDQDAQWLRDHAAEAAQLIRA